MRETCRLTLLWILITWAGWCASAGAGPGVPPTGALRMGFDFGPGPVQAGFIRVLPEARYRREFGYGFEGDPVVEGVNRDGGDASSRDFCTSDQPWYFSVKVPEGNYRVTLTLGDISGTSSTTVKAELRRLMLEKIETESGQIVKRSFVVNVRTPDIPDGGQVRLKGREKTSEAWAWDDKLTVEFNGKRPCVCAVEIMCVDDVPTLFLLGDSTVCDQPLEPWSSWGQMLTRFFNSDIAIANHAESGESLRSSLGARRVDKVFSRLKPGDYVFAQFGHNDMKSRTPNASDIYKADLKKLVADVRAKGATPVLITSMERKAGVERDTLNDYPAKVREVAAEDDVALIDLHAMSKVLYRALGDDLDRAFQDGTHHNGYGSYELAKCVVEGIKKTKLDLTRFIADDYQSFDPSRPDSVDRFDVPPSPMGTSLKPDGN